MATPRNDGPKRHQYIEYVILKLVLQITSDPGGYPATVSSLLTLLQQTLPGITNITNQELVDTLKRLRPKYLTLWKWSDEARRFIEYPTEISEDGNFFYRGDFRLRHTPMTDPYAQELQRLFPSHETASRSATISPVLILISHSSKDVSLATEVTEFLRLGLALRPEQIRCSSVDGYRLPAGVHTEAQLREEVNSADVLIGLITPSSLSSPYVLFELGARWGANLRMIPLLAGVKADDIRGPLSSLNALSSSSAGQLHQLLTDISELLNVPVQSAASYQRRLEAVMREAEAVGSTSVANAPPQARMVFEESVYWKRDNGGREGPYCPTCYDDKKKQIHLTPGATKGTFGCGVCHNSFTTSEYVPGPAFRVQRYRPR